MAGPSSEFFYCSVCSKKFKTRKGMQDHFATHDELFNQPPARSVDTTYTVSTEDGQFRCGTCSKNFPSQWSFNSHFLTCSPRRPRAPEQTPLTSKAAQATPTNQTLATPPFQVRGSSAVDIPLSILQLGHPARVQRQASPTPAKSPTPDNKQSTALRDLPASEQLTAPKQPSIAFKNEQVKQLTSVLPPIAKPQTPSRDKTPAKSPNLPAPVQLNTPTISLSPGQVKHLTSALAPAERAKTPTHDEKKPANSREPPAPGSRTISLTRAQVQQLASVLAPVGKPSEPTHDKKKPSGSRTPKTPTRSTNKTTAPRNDAAVLPRPATSTENIRNTPLPVLDKRAVFGQNLVATSSERLPIPAPPGPPASSPAHVSLPAKKFILDMAPPMDDEAQGNEICMKMRRLVVQADMAISPLGHITYSGVNWKRVPVAKQAILYDQFADLCHLPESLQLTEHVPSVTALNDPNIDADYPVEDFELSPKKSSSRPSVPIVAISCIKISLVDDCEEVVKIAALDIMTGRVLMSCLVHGDPKVTVKDWRSSHTGMSSLRDMEGARQHGYKVLRGWSAARAALWRFISNETILVGHNLRTDLDALRMIHGRGIDIAKCVENVAKGPLSPQQLRLDSLSRDILKRPLVTDVRFGRDALLNTFAIRELTLHLIKNKEEVKAWAKKESIAYQRVCPSARR